MKLVMHACVDCWGIKDNLKPRKLKSKIRIFDYIIIYLYFHSNLFHMISPRHSRKVICAKVFKNKSIGQPLKSSNNYDCRIF